MRVIYTEEALENLDGILAFIASNYPTVYGAFQIRLQSVVKRISEWPDSAQEVAERPG
jgi:plasmid stabilization system protein ParE